MRGFDETAELVCCDESDVISVAAMNDDGFPGLYRFIKQRFQIRSCLGVGSLDGHTYLYRKTVQVIPWVGKHWRWSKTKREFLRQAWQAHLAVLMVNRLSIGECTADRFRQR